MKNLTSSKYWSVKHPEIEKAILGDSHHNIEYLYPKLDKQMKTRKGQSIIELGCAPGQGLRKISERYNLIPNGCDFVKEIDVVGEIFGREFPQSKFFKCDLGREEVKGQYDIVMSGGLIEHFDDVEDIVQKHTKATKPGGLLIINTPNLSFWRALFWRLFDPKLLAGHNPKATNLRYVKKLLEKNDCRILDAGYFGEPHIWIEDNRRPGAQKVTNFINRKLKTAKLSPSVAMPFVYWIAAKV